jgi:hypothetical protein
MNTIKLSIVVTYCLVCLIGYSQNGRITNIPKYSSKNNNDVTIKKIEITDDFTIIKLSHIAPMDNYMIWFNDKSYLQAGNIKYKILKSDIGFIKDNGKQQKYKGERIDFYLYYEPIKRGIETIDIIESSESNAFNFYGVQINNLPLRLSEQIKIYVESKVNEWQQKGEFEKSSEYKTRVNENTRAKIIEEFQIEAVNEFKKQYAKSINFKDLKLGTYDADNECFLLSSSQLSEFVVPVPRIDAPAFKQNFNTLIFQGTDFFIKDDNFVLSHIEIIGTNNKKYTYDSKNKNTYANTNIDYKFADFEVDVEDKTATNNNKIQKSANTITVGKSDVDIDIPASIGAKTNTYALIIGNEDYSSFQTGLNTEVNVDYAMNDAKIFKEYCNKTLGIPEKQIKLLTNATFGQMNQGISWLNNLAKIDNGNAELIFYYSGHGLPDEQTKESYLMPVDISGSNVTQAVKLTDIYNKLNEHPSKKVTVFLDACFSGGARNQGLIAMKGLKIKPKDNMVTGNMIVLSSSTGEESSGVFREKQHGFMTYFLLKKIQETKGNITYKELADYVIENVKKETALSGKNQTPQLNYSPNVEGTWTNWKIK